MSDLSSPDLKAIEARLDRLAFLVRGPDAIKFGAIVVPSRDEHLELDALIGGNVPDLLAEVAHLRTRVDQQAEHLDKVGQIHNGCPNTNNDDLDCPWCRIAELEIEHAEIQARVDVLTGQVAGRDATIQRVRDRHSPLKIYTECGHDGDEDCVGEIVEIESDVGWTCETGYLYSICRECCTENGEQTEECAASHDHSKNGPLCPTRKDIDGNPADDGSQTDG